MTLESTGLNELGDFLFNWYPRQVLNRTITLAKQLAASIVIVALISRVVRIMRTADTIMNCIDAVMSDLEPLMIVADAIMSDVEPLRIVVDAILIDDVAVITNFDALEIVASPIRTAMQSCWMNRNSLSCHRCQQNLRALIVKAFFTFLSRATTKPFALLPPGQCHKRSG